MHLVCLGAVRRILNYLKKGPYEKVSANNINEISMLLLSLNGHMPSEFVRQPRSLKYLDRWKATELRQFLLYSGPVVLRNILSDDAYQHFLVLSMTLTILLQSDVEIRSHYLEYSQQLIQQFVYNSKTLSLSLSLSTYIYIYRNTFTFIYIETLSLSLSIIYIICFMYLMIVNLVVVLLTVYHVSRLKISCKD